MKYAINQEVTILNGKYKGLAGIVTERDSEAGNITVNIQGVKNEKTIDENVVLSVSQVRAL